MKQHTILYIIVLASTLAQLACNQRDNSSPKQSMSEARKQLEHINRVLIDKDKEQIEAYIERHQLFGMSQNQSGLYYLVWGVESEKKAKPGNIVALNYKISLLDGTLCYSSEDGKPKEFMVGKGGVESGLEIGVLLMSLGQKAKFIMPPHLAHGLLGDNDKIPPLAILVFDVELISIIDN
jgi:FKBP-type peptidyl-prolyl cis-trans isomerase FkpA